MGMWRWLILLENNNKCPAVKISDMLRAFFNLKCRKNELRRPKILLIQVAVFVDRIRFKIVIRSFADITVFV